MISLYSDIWSAGLLILIDRNFDITNSTNNGGWYYYGDVKVVWPMIVSDSHVNKTAGLFLLMLKILHPERALNYHGTHLFRGFKVAGVCGRGKFHFF